MWHNSYHHDRHHLDGHCLPIGNLLLGWDSKGEGPRRGADACFLMVPSCAAMVKRRAMYAPAVS